MRAKKCAGWSWQIKQNNFLDAQVQNRSKFIDMNSDNEIYQKFAYLKRDLVEEFIRIGTISDIPKDTQILRAGQYVKVIPIVIEGLIKVFTRYEDKELLLYYIQSKESCIMSFSASLKNEPSKVFAIAEEDTRALLLPVDKVEGNVVIGSTVNQDALVCLEA